MQKFFLLLDLFQMEFRDFQVKEWDEIILLTEVILLEGGFVL